MDKYNYKTVDYIYSDSELESDSNSDGDTNSEPETNNKFNKINTNIYTQNVLLDSSSAKISRGNLIFDFINSGNTNTNTINGGIFGKFNNIINIDLIRADIKYRYFNINSSNNKLFFKCNNINYLLEIPIGSYDIDQLINECNNVSNFFNLDIQKQLKYFNSSPFNLLFYQNTFYLLNGVYGQINIDNINSTLNTILGIGTTNEKILTVDSSIGYGIGIDPSNTIGILLDSTNYNQLKTSSRIFNNNSEFSLSGGKLYILDHNNKGYTMFQLNYSKFNNNKDFESNSCMYITIDNIYVYKIDFQNTSMSIVSFKVKLLDSIREYPYADITIDNDNNIKMISKNTLFNSINKIKNIKIMINSINESKLVVSYTDLEFLSTYMKVVVHNIDTLNEKFYYIKLLNNGNITLFTDIKLLNQVYLHNIEYHDEIFLTHFNIPDSSVYIHTNTDELNTTPFVYELLINVSKHDGILITKNHFKNWMIVTNSSEETETFNKIGLIKDYNMLDGEINVNWKPGIYDDKNQFTLTNNQNFFVIYPSCTFELNISNTISELSPNRTYWLVLMRTDGYHQSLTEYFKIPFSNKSTITNESDFVNHVKEYLPEKTDQLFINLNEFAINSISNEDQNQSIFKINTSKKEFNDGSKVYLQHITDPNLAEGEPYYVKNRENTIDEIILHTDRACTTPIKIVDNTQDLQISTITNKTITIECRRHTQGMILTIVPYFDILHPPSDNDFPNKMYLKQTSKTKLCSDREIYGMIQNTHQYGGINNVNISKISSNNLHEVNIVLDFNTIIINNSHIIIDGVNGYIPPSTYSYTNDDALIYENNEHFPKIVYSIQTDKIDNYYQGWKLYADDQDIEGEEGFKGIVFSSHNATLPNGPPKHELTVLSRVGIEKTVEAHNFSNVKLVPYKLNGNTFILKKSAINSYQLMISCDENGLQTIDAVSGNPINDIPFKSLSYEFTNITNNSDTGYIILKPHIDHTDMNTINNTTITELIENKLYEYKTIPGYIKGITEHVGQYLLLPPLKYTPKLDTLYVDIVIDEIPHISCKLNMRGDKVLERVPHIKYEGDMISYIPSTSKKVNYNLPISIDKLSVKILDDMGNMYFIDEASNFSIELKLTMIKDYEDLLNNIT